MNTIFIVEGKSDTRRLKEVYQDVITFETSGLGLDDDKINKLKKLSKDYELIVFTDPDGPGEKIRSKLNQNIDGLKHAYLPNEKALSKNKCSVGVEHASSSDIIEALSHLYESSSVKAQYKISDLVNWNIYENKEKRLLFCNKLHIAFGNNKKVLEQLNVFNIKLEEIEKVVEELNGASE